MRLNSGLFLFTLISFSLILTLGCDKDILSLPIGKGNFINLSISDITSITANSAKCNFIVTDLNSETVNEQGICWDINKSPTISNKKISVPLGTGSFPAILNNLVPNQTYYIRPFIKTNLGLTMYGDEKYFITIAPQAPKIEGFTLNTKTFSSVNFTTSISDGGSSILTRGICFSTNSNPTISNSKIVDGIGSGSFTSNISLLSNTKYYFRPFATNQIGTSYGPEQSIILNLNVIGPSVTDASGNVYNSVQIGDQTWTKSNLITTKYQNGQSIPNVTDTNAWANLTIGAYCDFTNNSTYGNIYGHLYNYFTVTDSRSICPAGWHVPSKIEFEELIRYLGGEINSVVKLKEAGNLYWENANGDNTSGFSARAGSWRGSDGNFYYFVRTGGASFWSSTKDDIKYPWFLNLDLSPNNRILIDSYFGQAAGTSIRCLKN